MNAHDNDEQTRTARLFRNGRSQAVRIPREFEFAGQEVNITQVNERKLVIEAKPTGGQSPMLEWLARNGPIEDFPTDPGNEGLLPLDDVEL